MEPYYNYYYEDIMLRGTGKRIVEGFSAEIW